VVKQAGEGQTGITVNKNEINYVEDETVTELLARLRYRFPLVHVAINGELVPREKYGETYIPEGAAVSVIHMISGG
jgi:thiamine biosynthesis protein ThiS